MRLRERKCVYLAGPDVFYPGAHTRALDLKLLCARSGFDGLFPLDADLTFLDSEGPRQRGRRISQANVRLIESADAVLANVTPFRGPSADAGTVWEMGYASGMGKPVVAYSTESRSYEQRVPQQVDGSQVEAFDSFDNIMVAHSVLGCFSNPREALERLSGYFSGEDR